MRCRGAVSAIVRCGESAGDGVFTGTRPWRGDRPHFHGDWTTVVCGRGFIHDHLVAAFHGVVGRHKIELWRRRVLHGDGLERCRAVSTLVCGGERACDHVIAQRFSVYKAYYSNLNHPAIVRGRCTCVHNLFAALHSVVSRNRQDWRCRVLHSDGLRCRRAVAAFVCRRECAGDGVVSCTVSLQHILLLLEIDRTTVVNCRSFCEYKLVAALRSVIGRDRQGWRHGVLHRHQLHMHAAVSTCIGHRPTTIKHVALRAVSVVTDFNAFRNVQVPLAVVRRQNRGRTFHGRNIIALHDHVRRAVQNGRGRHILTLHRHHLRQNASALVNRLKNEFRVFVTLRVILCTCQVHHDISAQSGHFLPVQFTIPTEPSSKALIAVVVVGTDAQLKAL